jgi:hypothetical protein
MLPQLLAYYFPGFHYDPIFYPGLPPGWSEWELLRRARPFFAGHKQPRQPAWGYEDELAPGVLARKLSVAGHYGIDALVVETYEYERQSPGFAVLQQALEQTSPGSARPAMMWANHQRYWCYPEPENSPGRVYLQVDYSREQLKRQIESWCEKAWCHPHYYRLPNGLPLFILYSPQLLVNGAGSLDALYWFVDYIRTVAKRAGLPGIHVHACSTSYVLDVSSLRVFDSCSDYLVVGYTENPPNKEPRLDVPSLRGMVTVPLTLEERRRLIAGCYRQSYSHMPIPYLPSVTVGRDCTPRVRALGDERIGHYSARPTITDDIPVLTRMALQTAIDYLRQIDPPVPMTFINAWNEWTEGAYLEPDTEHGVAALEGISKIWREAWTLRSS